MEKNSTPCELLISSDLRSKAPAFLVNFSNGSINLNSSRELRFKSFRPTDDNDTVSALAERVLVADNGRLNYHSDVISISKSDKMRYYIGVRSKTGGVMNVYDALPFQLRPKVETDSQQSQLNERNVEEKLNDLTLKFSGKDMKCSMNTRLKYSTDAVSLEHTLDDLSLSIADLSVSMPGSSSIEYISPKHASECATVLINGSLKEFDIDYDMLLSDVLDHYRTFQMLERLLHYPKRLTEQWIFQIAPSMQRMLIERYYEFNDIVIREFLGKKLSARNRKDLDDVSEKTGIQIKSCRRQFDNVKRVYKVVEDCTGDLVKSIRTMFLLSENLARKYAAIVYLTSNRFETSKKKLQYLKFDDFLYCANWMMCNWSCPKPDCTYEETAMEMDREFLQELRDLKLILDKDSFDELKSNIQILLRGKLPERIYADLDSNFKSFTRTFVNIAYGLNHSKEIRDLFVDIVEKFIEPLRQGHWTEKDLKSFLDVYISAASRIHIFKSDPHLLEVWERYMSTMSYFILKMYHS